MATTLLASAAKSAAGTGSTVARVVDKLPHVRTNVSSNERWLSLVAGAGLLGFAATGRGRPLLAALAGAGFLYRGATGNCMLYQALGVSTSDSTKPLTAIAGGHGSRVDASVIVNRPATDVYRFWRDFENLPRFMTHLLDVNTSTDGTSHWIARGPLGITFEWEAEIIADRPGEVISWRSLDGADVDTAGSVHFTQLPHGRGTEVRVGLKYDPPGGKLGTAIARLVGQSPQAQVEADLQRFKAIMEAGQVATTEGQPSGRS